MKFPPKEDREELVLELLVVVLEAAAAFVAALLFAALIAWLKRDVLLAVVPTEETIISILFLNGEINDAAEKPAFSNGI